MKAVGNFRQLNLEKALIRHIFQSPWLHGENGKEVVILVPIFKEDLKAVGNFRQFNLEKA